MGVVRVRDIIIGFIGFEEFHTDVVLNLMSMSFIFLNPESMIVYLLKLLIWVGIETE